jgi:predicted PurR-regulated permease PerM
VQTEDTCAPVVNASKSKLERTLGWAILLLLFGGCLLVLLPFIPALLWALVLCVTTWPVYQRVLRLCRQRHTLGAFTMSLAMILIILLPLVAVGVSLADNVQELSAATQRWVQGGPPAAPAWLVKLPVVGKKATDAWTTLTTDTEKLIEKLKQWIPVVSAALLKFGLLIGAGLFQIALSIFIAFFLLRDGESLRSRIRSAAERIGGQRGLHLLDIAAGTIRGVVYGILGTALLQAVMAGIGFLIAGVPGALALALLLFFLSVVPMGPAIILLPAALWLFHEGQTGWGIFMIIWGLIVSSVDNLIKPWLISQGSQMPFLLILFGVLGGALTFGFIGVFLGPTLLAVGFRLVEEWSSLGWTSPRSDVEASSAR